MFWAIYSSYQEPKESIGYMKYMTDCIFCTIPDIICKKVPAFFITQAAQKVQAAPDQENARYLRYSIINISPILSKAEFSKMTVFTPGSRLVLSLEDADQLIAHRKAWTDIMNGKEPYGIIFDKEAELMNIDLQFRLENLKLPKDWDIIKITDTQYVLSKRAAKILVEATLQYHDPVKQLLQSLVILKVFDLDGKIIGGE